MNRWYFWVLAPVMLSAAVVVPLTARPPSLIGYLVVYLFSLILVLGTLGLADPIRNRWALRCVAGGVLLAGVCYFGVELTRAWGGQPTGVLGRRSRASLWNASLFLLIFGVPALKYLLQGRSGSIVDDIAAPDAGQSPEELSDSTGAVGERRRTTRG